LPNSKAFTRQPEGCPLCGKDLQLTKAGTWPKHKMQGSRYVSCDAGGLGPHGSDEYFRTFLDRDNPTSWPLDGHRKTCEFSDHGDGLGISNTLEIRDSFGAAVAAEVKVIIREEDLPRLFAEIHSIAERRGWKL
jgi:hypothetical protein